MTAQADKESGPATTVKSSSENGSNDLGIDDKSQNQSMSLKASSHKIDEQEAPPSRHLWVGNVSTSVTEAELAEQFSRFGDIDSITAYPSRNYAFINFKTVEDGVYAKKGLQGTVLRGLAIRIEFAKGAKPSKHLWIGNVCSSVTKEQLEAECKKFGVVDDVRILRERNCAFVDFTKTDDAIAAFESLNKKLLGTEELCIEYVKSQLQPKKDGKFEGQPRLDERAAFQDQGPAEASSGKTSPEKPKRDRDEPSEMLWVGFPLCMKIDERKLHRAFSPFGGIERITTFPGRTYAFVQFHSVKAATRAKNVLQGKLFNDPRVSISFAKSEIGPVDHHDRTTGPFLSPSSASVDMPPILFPKAGSFVNPRNDRFLSLNTFRPHSPNFRRRPEGDMNEANIFFQSSRYEAGFRDDMDRVMRPDLDMWGGPALPEGAFMPPRHTPHMEERWNIQEEAQGRREPKRPRVGGNHSGRGGLVELNSLDSRGDREVFQVVKAHDYLSKVTRMSNNNPVDNWEDHDGLKRSLQPRRHPPGSKMDPPRPLNDNWVHHGMPVDHPKEGFQWQGVIAKSGTAVCRARCYPVGKVTNAAFPEVVNCTARTSLDMLARHISEVGEFSLVSFIPHGELDVEPYQDFIVYLSEKNRAAVCKLSHESTLFLVPPSEFVEHFLKVGRDNSILGVVLKLQQPFSSSAEQAGILQPLQTERLLSAIGLPEESYQKSTSQAPPEHQLPAVMPMPVPFHAIPSSTDVNPVLPQHASLQSSTSAGPVFAPVVVASSTGGMNGNSVGPNNPPGHGLIIDDNRLAHPPPGYASMHQEQHSTPLIGGYSLAPTVDLHPHQEQGMQIHPQSLIPSANQVSSTAGQYPTSHIHNNQMKNVGQNLSGSTPYLQQPPLPQYPHPSTQQKQSSQPPQIPLPNVLPSHSEQFSQLTSLTTHQLQPFSESLQPIVQPQHPTSGPPQHQIAPTSNFGPVTEQWSMTATQISHPPPVAQKDQGGGLTTSIDAEQHELLQLAQQKLSEVRGDSGEDHKRFQATLELAAALLQQLQQRSKT